jgi:16S rRNA (uracil1498-N3)-methyltransferase
MKHRLYLPEAGEISQAADPAPEFQLQGDRAHYLHRVLRLRADSELACFDGRGREWRTRLLTSTAKGCELRIIELIRDEPRPTELILAQAWLKGSAMDTVVQKVTELGVTRIWLFNADRTLKPSEKRIQNKLRHLGRIVVSASEQCGTTWLPQLELKSTLLDVLDSSSGHQRVVLDPGHRTLEVGADPQPLLLAVGPEGGWSEEERTVLGQLPDVSSMSLGTLILRAETAPLAALAAVRQSWGWR